MISVVIPLYNKEHQISETLRSVLEQTFQDFEVVIVDDGSTDKSAEEALKIRDPRIRLVRQENAGVSAARNRGVEEARFDLVAFLDADDLWKPEYLQTQYDLSRKYPQCDVFACNYEFVYADESTHPTVIRKLPFEGQDGILDNYFEVASCSHPPICSISIMVRKEALLRIGGFPVGIRSGEDLLTWARLACSCKKAYSKKNVASFISTSSNQPESKAFLRLDNQDPVLKQLLHLKSKHGNNIKHIDDYIIRWYKIQSIIFLETKNRSKARKYAIIAIKNKGNIFIFSIIFLIACMPEFMINFILKLK